MTSDDLFEEISGVVKRHTETCRLCGRIAEGVRYQTAHVGGHLTDQVVGPFCEDRGDCWARWNEQQMKEVKVDAAETNKAN